MIHFETVEQEGNFYSVYFTDDHYTQGLKVSNKISIHRNVLEREANRSGMLEEISFQEFEEQLEYRKIFDQFVITLATDMLYERAESKEQYGQVKGNVKEF